MSPRNQVQHGLPNTHRCCLRRAAWLRNPHLRCCLQAMAEVAHTSQRLRLAASKSWTGAAQMQHDDFNRLGSLNTTQTDKKNTATFDAPQAYRLLAVHATASFAGHASSASKLHCLIQDKTMLHFIYAQTVALDTVNCYIKHEDMVWKAQHCAPSLALRSLSFLLKANSHDPCTALRRKMCATFAACHSGFRTLTPPDPEAHTSCSTNSLIAPGSPCLQRRMCEAVASNAVLRFTPQLVRIA